MSFFPSLQGMRGRSSAYGALATREWRLSLVLFFILGRIGRNLEGSKKDSSFLRMASRRMCVTHARKPEVEKGGKGLEMTSKCVKWIQMGMAMC